MTVGMRVGHDRKRRPPAGPEPGTLQLHVRHTSNCNLTSLSYHHNLDKGIGNLYLDSHCFWHSDSTDSSFCLLCVLTGGLAHIWVSIYCFVLLGCGVQGTITNFSQNFFLWSLRTDRTEIIDFFSVKRKSAVIADDTTDLDQNKLIEYGDSAYCKTSKLKKKENNQCQGTL